MGKFRTTRRLIQFGFWMATGMQKIQAQQEAFERKLDEMRESICGEVKRQGMLTRREYWKAGSDRDGKDKRSPVQRKFIDKAVRLYVELHDIKRLETSSFHQCCLRFWEEAQTHFRDIRQYENNVFYDYWNFYDTDAITARLRQELATDISTPDDTLP